MAKTFFLPALFIFCFCGTAVSQKQILFYDSLWNKTPEAKAYMRAEVVSQNNLVNYKTFFLSNGKLRSNANYKDTSYSFPIGTRVNFFENGNLQDSSFYDNESKRIFSYHYYINGKPMAIYILDSISKKETTKGFDFTGTEIKNYIYEQEAEFKGGSSEWIRFLSKTLNSNVPVKKKAKAGTYQVIIKFIVNADGAVGTLEAETAFGHGMEEEAIRVISRSPKWNNAIQFNRPVNAYRRQPITFVVQEK